MSYFELQYMCVNLRYLSTSNMYFMVSNGNLDHGLRFLIRDWWWCNVHTRIIFGVEDIYHYDFFQDWDVALNVREGPIAI